MLKLSPRFLFAIALSAGCLVGQQQRALTHSDYDHWQSLRGTAYSHDGAWIANQVEPAWGDGVLVIRQTTGDKQHRFDLASGARFSSDSRYVFFTIGKSKVAERDKKIEELRKQAQKQKEGAGNESGEGRPAFGGRRGGATAGRAPGGQAPRARTGGRRGGRGGFGRGGGGGTGSGGGGSGDLRALDLRTGELEVIGKVKRWTLSDEAPFLLYQKDDSKEGEDGEADAKTEGGEGAAAPEGAGRRRGARGGRGGGRGGAAGRGAGAGGGGRRGSGDPTERKRAEGSELTVRDLSSGSERTIADVASYGLSRHSKWMWFHTSAKKPKEGSAYGLFLQAPAGGDTIELLGGVANVANVTMHSDEQVVAFTSDKQEFDADKPNSDLYLWEGEGLAQRIAFVGAAGMPPGKRVGGRPSFSRDGSAVSFSVEDPPKPAALPILDEDKVELDLWNWRDGQLQTMQAKGRGRSGGGSFTAVYHRDSDKLVVLGDERTPSLRFVGPGGERMIANDSKPYAQEVQWDGRYSDVWLVDAHDGTRTRVLEKQRANVTNSPNGRYLIWFDAAYHWWTMDTETGVRRDLTGNLPVPFHKHDDDHPSPDRAYGIAGWTDNDGAVLLYDEFDVWKVSPKNGQAVCVTDGYGRDRQLELRLQRLPNYDDIPFVSEELLLSARDVETMAQGFFADSLHRSQRPAKLWMADKSISGLTSPRNSSRLFFRQSTFREYGDLWTAKADFTDQQRLTDVNPQQKDFRWGDAELVHWIDGNGDRRKGVLVKPDGFDPKKKYPMMVYFYEKMSNRLHSYVAPTPGTSPNASYYVSNGYLWFMPDIVYEEGYPGPSCVKCVVSGVQHLIAQGFVDADAIGAAGHSWGGYQTAFLVTRTNIFKAVESGAPVSNMLSAYGGIRYDSGMSRQFQYEQTQSRIGGSPWQYPLRYQENSPIHFADKVETPVLILHNDKDGAVPWTQGIEYLVALKRLGKEAYLFNYNGEPHGLRKMQNKKDWTRRMAEYFDHHLKGAPAPKWMTDGVDYKDRTVEKLPFAQSYIDAHVKPPKAKPAPVTSEPASAEPASSSSAATETGSEASASSSGSTSSGSTGGDGATAAAGLEIGRPAPSFALMDEADVEHQLADYRGQRVLVWFYPKADTPGCTAQGCGLRDEFARFEQQGVAVLGVSFDDQNANTAFRMKHDFPFPLLCDTERKMAVAYGAASDAGARFARRIAVLIDGKGRIEKVWSRVDPRSFAVDALSALSL